MTCSALQHRAVPYECNVCVCVYSISQSKAKITNLLLLKASYCAVLYRNRMPAKVFNVSARQHPLCAAAFLISVELLLVCTSFCCLHLLLPLMELSGTAGHSCGLVWTRGLECNCVHRVRSLQCIHRSAEFTCVVRAGYVGLQALA